MKKPCSQWRISVPAVFMLLLSQSALYAQDSDPVKSSLMQIINAVRGGAGDAVVIGSLVFCLIAAYKKMPRVAGGFFVLLLGTVIIRVMISVFF